MTVIALPESDRALAKAWLRHGAALCALLALTVLIFRDAVSAAVKVWWVSPTYSHCFLIVPIVLWLAWEKRTALAATAPTLFPQALLLTPCWDCCGGWANLRPSTRSSNTRLWA